MDQKCSTGRLARWALEIQGYQFDIIHRPGKNNQVADALSRRDYDDDDENKLTEEIVIASISEKSTSTNSLQNLNSDSNDNETAKSSASANYSQTPELTEVSFFYSDFPDILTVESEVEISLQNPNLSDLSEIAKLQQTCPDFPHIYEYMYLQTCDLQTMKSKYHWLRMH